MLCKNKVHVNKTVFIIAKNNGNEKSLQLTKKIQKAAITLPIPFSSKEKVIDEYINTSYTEFKKNNQ